MNRWKPHEAVVNTSFIVLLSALLERRLDFPPRQFWQYEADNGHSAITDSSTIDGSLENRATREIMVLMECKRERSPNGDVQQTNKLVAWMKEKSDQAMKGSAVRMSKYL